MKDEPVSKQRSSDAPASGEPSIISQESRTRQRQSMLALVVFLLAVFVIVSYRFYKETEIKVAAQSGVQQQLIAKTAAAGVEGYFDTIHKRLEKDSSDLASKPPTAVITDQSLDALYLDLSYRIAGVYILNNKLQLVAFRSHDLQLRAFVPMMTGSLMTALGRGEPAVSAPTLLNNRDYIFEILQPVLDSNHRLKFVLGAAVPLHNLSSLYLDPLNSTSTHYAWMLDHKGTLLYNPRHPEMLGHQILDNRKECFSCHIDFSTEQQMVRGETGTGTIDFRNKDRDLVAFTPIRFGTQHWSLAVSIPYTEATALTRDSFRNTLLLVAFFFSIIIGGAILVMNMHARRIKAEEEARFTKRQAQLERQLLQSEQLAGIGRMTSHIAHQIKTPLSAISLNIEYLQKEMRRRLLSSGVPLGDSHLEDIENVAASVTDEIERLAALIEDYLKFARLPKPSLREGSLSELVESLATFLEKELSDHKIRIKVVREGSDTGPKYPDHVLMDENLLWQAMTNLIRNSADAMPSGGVITLSITSAQTDVELKISDEGVGIAGDKLPHIFEPFFTTKADGTGLGLSYVHRIVTEHHAFIACQSRLGVGTSFTISFPPASRPRKEAEILAAVES
jgi:signal transduction histidine kinase